jgi:hypothetical protein
MTPKERARFFALRKKGKKSRRTDAEQSEYVRLYEMRHSDILSMIPLPTCCEAAVAVVKPCHHTTQVEQPKVQT